MGCFEGKGGGSGSLLGMRVQYGITIVLNEGHN